MTSDALILLTMGIAHIVLGLICVVCLLMLRKRPRRVHLIWALCIPVFGPLLLAVIIHKTRADTQKYKVTLGAIEMNMEQHSALMRGNADANEAVPLEEALLINEPRRRRRLMMNILRRDPMRYLDMLLLARFNEDTETAHYATATIMEIQRNLQMDVQREQALAAESPDDLHCWREYIVALDRYIKSMLISGQLLYRSRSELKAALKIALDMEYTPEWQGMYIRNCLALGEAAEAREWAEQFVAREPRASEAWQELLRVCVDSNDQQGLRNVLERASTAGVNWTLEAREYFKYWTEAANEAKQN